MTSPWGNALPERLRSKLAATPSGCWIWTAARDRDGYGHYSVSPQRRKARVHRFVYELLVGPIPEGLVIDHLCRVRACVNPLHLQPVTDRANLLRSPLTFASRWAARTHCANGHEFTEDNTAWRKRRDNQDKTYRECRTCRRDYERRQSRRRRAEATGGTR